MVGSTVSGTIANSPLSLLSSTTVDRATSDWSPEIAPGLNRFETENLEWSAAATHRIVNRVQFTIAF